MSLNPHVKTTCVYKDILLVHGVVFIYKFHCGYVRICKWDNSGIPPFWDYQDIIMIATVTPDVRQTSWTTSSLLCSEGARLHAISTTSCATWIPHSIASKRNDHACLNWYRWYMIWHKKASKIKCLQLDIILLDFAKVFNKVPHQCLIPKTHHYSIRGSSHLWTINFLGNRS